MVTVCLWLHGSVPMVTDTSPLYCLFSPRCDYERWSEPVLTLEGHFLPFVGAAEACFTSVSVY